MSDDTSPLAKRAASRLAQLLDEQGFPLDALGRTNALAAELSTSFQRAQQLLSGLLDWSNCELDQLCSRFDKQPGYFLDAQYGGPMPSDSVVVPASDGGEAIVWRAPHGFLRRPPNPGTSLRYVTARQEVLGFAPGTLFIHAEEFPSHDNVTEGELYVVDTGEELTVMRCTGSREAIASFEPNDSGVTVVVPFHPEAAASGNPRIAGRVIATIAPAP